MPWMFFLLFINLNINAFTLNNNVKLFFNHDTVKVNLAGGLCQNLGVSDSELLSIIQDAVDQYWNKSPTSKLKMNAGNSISLSGTYRTAQLCTPSGGACNPNSSLAVSSDILITCNVNATTFSTTQTVASSLPNNINGNTITGSLIMINDNSGNVFQNYSRSEKISTIAHEIGHAIGLGHSPVTDSLMYYNSAPIHEHLGQDDIDGITYLYPKEQPMSCGQITYRKNDSHSSQFIGLLIGIILSYLFFGYLKLRPRFSHSRS
jgi:hypothetical protein